NPEPVRPVAHAPLAALLSAIIPGLGYAYAGRSKRAFQFFVVDFFLVASIVVAVTWFRSDVYRALLTPNALIVLLVVNVLLLGYRAYAVLGAYRAAPRREVGGWRGLALLVAAALVLVPHLALGRATLTAHDVITSVFGPRQPVAGEDTTTTTTTDPGPTTTVTGPTTTTLPPTTTTTLPPRIWDGMERLNIALLGSDMRPNQEDLDPNDPRYVGHRTDVMIVVSINPRPPYDVAILSVPRFLSNFEMPEGYGVPRSIDEWDWIGHVYRRAEDIAPE